MAAARGAAVRSAWRGSHPHALTGVSRMDDQGRASDDPGSGGPGAGIGGEGGEGTARDADRPVRLTAWVSGRVQGVGFRWWTQDQADALGLAGYAQNLDDGRVEVVAEGPARDCRELLARLRGPGAPGRVRAVVEQWSDTRGDARGFAAR